MASSSFAPEGPTGVANPKSSSGRSTLCCDCKVEPTYVGKNETCGQRFCDACWQRWWCFQERLAPQERHCRYKSKRTRPRRVRVYDEAKAKLKAFNKANLKTKAKEQETVQQKNTRCMGSYGTSVSEVPDWKRMESRHTPGLFYYFCPATGETRLPDTAPAPPSSTSPPSSLEPVPHAVWTRLESRSTPGMFYFYNRETGQSQLEPPSDRL